MREPVTEEAAIAAEIARIRSLPSEALRRRWQAVFRRKPPAALSKDLLGRMLVLQNNAELGLELSGLSAGFEAVATASAKFDLSLSLVERRGADGSPAGIEGALEYASDLFDRSSVEAIAGRLVRSTGLVLGRGWILLFVRNKVITRGGSSLLSHYFSDGNWHVCFTSNSGGVDATREDGRIAVAAALAAAQTFDVSDIGKRRRHQNGLIDRAAHRCNAACLIHRRANNGKV